MTSNSFPQEQEVRAVMKETGMDYLQARNHLLGRAELHHQEDRRFGDRQMLIVELPPKAVEFVV